MTPAGPRVAGIDPGTVSFGVCVLDAGSRRSASSAPARRFLPGRVVLLLDTCHAGDVLSGRKLRGVPSAVGGGVNRFIDELGALEQGVVVLTAATGTQASQESPEWGNGAFTKALLEGLGGRADYGKTGRVTLNMLDLYISERVRELTQGAQTPATAKPTTIPDFPLLLSR